MQPTDPQAQLNGADEEARISAEWVIENYPDHPDACKSGKNVLRLLGEKRSLEADQRRLDWLEKRGVDSTHADFGDDTSAGFLVSEDGDVLSGTVDAGYAFQLREAIDAARKEAGETQGVPVPPIR